MKLEKFYQSDFAKWATNFYSLANIEYFHQKGTFPMNDPKNGCTVLEWRMQLVDHITKGVFSELNMLRIALSQISNTPSDEFMENWEYTEKGYFQYHYFVVCHNISTLHDLFFRLVENICGDDSTLTNDKQKTPSWKDIKSLLNSRNEKPFTEISVILSDYYDYFSSYIEDRHKGSHEGLIYNNLFDDFYLTDIRSSLYSSNYDRHNEHIQFIKGTKENEEKLEKAKLAFIERINDILEKVDSSVTRLLEELYKVVQFKSLEWLSTANLNWLHDAKVDCNVQIDDNCLNRMAEAQIKYYYRNDK